VPQPPTREREKLPVVGHAQQHLGDRQRDQFAVGELRRPSRPAMTRTEEIVDLHIQCDDEGVEGGEHEAS
jgi:hypothetical protein